MLYEYYIHCIFTSDNNKAITHSEITAQNNKSKENGKINF